MNLDELKRQKEQLEEQIKREEGKEKARERLKAEAEKLGYTIEELFGATQSKDDSNKEKRGRKLALYQNPENKRATWSGEGDQPQWVKDWIAAGNELEDARFPGR